ncbi:MAG: thioredoxin [Pseudomarimonas sp.]
MNLPAASVSPHSFDATAATFEHEVMARSMTTPVLIDFWAPWCAPCKQLKPVLEKLADEFNGGFVLAKVNSDDEGQLAAMFGIRSLPTVMLMKEGQPVDGFMGAQPEAILRKFLAQHGIEVAANDGAQDELGDTAPALSQDEQIAQLREQIAADAAQPELRLDLALALAQIGETDEAGQLLDALPAKLASDDRVKRARATMGFAKLLRDSPPPALLAQRLHNDQNDHHARHLLGVHALVAGDPEAALELFIDLLRRDRTYADGIAKRCLLDAFVVIDDADLVSRYRRKMATLLF